MGAEPVYTFVFAVAEHEDGHWRAIAPQQLRQPLEARRQLGVMWRRIWEAPQTAQAATESGGTPASSASK